MLNLCKKACGITSAIMHIGLMVFMGNGNFHTLTKGYISDWIDLDIQVVEPVSNPGLFIVGHLLFHH